LKQVNQTLIDSEQRFRLAIATGRIGLWVWNSTNVTNSGDWSQRLKEIFGLPLDADQLQNLTKEVSAAQRISLMTRDHPVWSEVLRTGTDCVTGEFDHDPPRVRLVNREESPWHPWHGIAAYNPAIPLINKRLVSSGVLATLTVPMVIAGRVAGMIDIRFKQKREFRTEEIELTRALAHQAMLAIQLMRLSRENRQAAVVASAIEWRATSMTPLRRVSPASSCSWKRPRRRCPRI
jgi:GAF domain-containing protein